MLSACAPVSKPRLTSPEPVVVTRLQAVPVCPAEARIVVAAVPAIPDGAVLTGNAAGQAWLAQLVAYAGDMFERASDVREACQKGLGHE